MGVCGTSIDANLDRCCFYKKKKNPNISRFQWKQATCSLASIHPRYFCPWGEKKRRLPCEFCYMNLKYVAPRGVMSSPPPQLHSHVFPIFILRVCQIHEVIRMKQLLKIQPLFFFSLQTKQSRRKVHLSPTCAVIETRCWASPANAQRIHTRTSVFLRGEFCATRMRTGSRGMWSWVMLVTS